MANSDDWARVQRACHTWPSDQQVRWAEAMAPEFGRPLWKAVTQRQNAGVYSRYLAAAGTQGVCPEGVRRWVRELEQSGITVRTITGYLWAIHKVARVVSDDDISWLTRTCMHITAIARTTPKRKTASVTPAAAIYQFALEAILRAKQMGQESWVATQLFRDGLFLAFAICAPERLRALVSTRLDDLDLQRFRATYDAEVIKTGRSSERTFPVIVAALLREWIESWRPRWIAGPDHGHLWIAKGGRPVCAATIYCAVRALTAQAPWGYSITPHRLRDAAATALAEASPEAATLARTLLGHSSERMTAEYTETAKRIAASRQGRDLIAQGRNETGRRARSASGGRGTLLSHSAAKGRRRQAPI